MSIFIYYFEVLSVVLECMAMLIGKSEKTVCHIRIGMTDTIRSLEKESGRKIQATLTGNKKTWKRYWSRWYYSGIES